MPNAAIGHGYDEDPDRFIALWVRAWRELAQKLDHCFERVAIDSVLQYRPYRIEPAANHMFNNVPFVHWSAPWRKSP